MSSIKDFFTSLTGGGETMTRVTHGTNFQRWTFGCCSACCQCMPTSTDYMTYEMWGQGASGASASDCAWSWCGGSGSRYGAVRGSYLNCSSQRPICFCACSCYCCNFGCYGCYGHCGQFSRLCICGLGSSCAITGGGCVCAEGGYGYSVQYNENCGVDTNNTNAGGGGGGGGGVSGFSNCSVNGNVCDHNPDPDVTQGAAVSGGSEGPGLTAFCTTPCSCGLHVGGAVGTFQSCLIEQINCGGTGGWAYGTCNANNCRGVGGASWGGGGHSCCCGSPGNWAYYGCPGLSPGGGGTSAGACGGYWSECYSGLGGAGLVIVSIDT